MSYLEINNTDILFNASIRFTIENSIYKHYSAFLQKGRNNYIVDKINFLYDNNSHIKILIRKELKIYFIYQIN